MSETVDPGLILAGLKDFQRDTVEYVFEQLYGEPQAKRFLVADEVGLGKTLVARGVIAKAIEHLQRQGIKRVDVIYVCSNADIARQNINRLNVTGRDEFNVPTRLTLLPLKLHSIKDRSLNFVSFTPGTTFDLKSRGGVAQERALLFHLVRYAWDSSGLAAPRCLPAAAGWLRVRQLQATGGLDPEPSWQRRRRDRPGTGRLVRERTPTGR